MIFYFSASGNSQHAAERIAAALGDNRLISIGVAMRDGHFDFDVTGDKYIAFVAPTFAYTLPQTVADFVEKLNLTGVKKQYVFGAFTCGAGTGGECAALKILLDKKNIPFNGGFDIVMPDNYIVWSNVPSKSTLERKLNAADNTIDKIIETVKAGKNGYIDNKTPEMMFLPYSDVDSSRGIGDIYADDKCIGCGACVAMCPNKTIYLKDGHAEFKGKCGVCFTCLHRCVQGAIQYTDATVRKGRYQHPESEFKTRNNY